MSPTLYVITYHKFNHESGRLPLDPRFLNSDKNTIYYLIDQKCPAPLQGKKVIFEREIDPLLYEAGKYYFAEWSFLLSELKNSFCEYPFFMISSRFYEKNTWLPTDLNQEWDNIFNYLERYGWGYLPSYDRHLEWQDLSIYLSKRLLPVTQLGCDLIEKIYNISIPNDYRFMSDFYCNYIGFQSRQHLEEYVNFYMPLINFLFDSSYQPIDDLSKYVGSTKSYRKEKPFTFYLEIISHLFFTPRI